MNDLQLNGDEQAIFEALKLENYKDDEKIKKLENLKHEESTKYDTKYIVDSLIKKINN